MSRYVAHFSKTGTICYTSHLDMMRMFHRIFKRSGIKLAYSRGFNQHPKMGFAQPLSLGYIGLDEIMEFETEVEYDPAYLHRILSGLVPPGIRIFSCQQTEPIKKTLAARTEAAEYTIDIPLKEPLKLTEDEVKGIYTGQEEITALKKQKKKKDPVQIDIKPMIRKISFAVGDNVLRIDTVLDSGSVSNLSPELVIETVQKCLGMDIDRSEIEVTRKHIFIT